MTKQSIVAGNDRIGMAVERLVPIVLAIYILSYVIEGPLRYALALIGVGSVIYIRDIFIFGATFAPVLYFISGRRASFPAVVFCLIVGLAIILWLYFSRNSFQTIFGIKILLPFAAGFVNSATIFLQNRRLSKFAALIFWISFVGVILDFMLPLPWEGFMTQVAGVEVSVGKVWYAGDWQRLSGFARASYDAAVFMMFAYLVAFERTQGIKWVLSLSAAIVGIVLTTTKGIFLVLGLVIIAEVAVRMSDRGGRILVKAMLAGVVSLGLILPLISLFVKPSLYFRPGIERALLFSFFDRMRNTWPQAMAKLDSDSSILFGLGPGSIGAAQAYFDAYNFNPADNVFVYTVVTFGVVGLTLFVMAMLRAACLAARAVSPLRLKLVLALLAYGMTTNIYDSALMGLLLGATLGVALTTEPNTGAPVNA